MGESIDIEYDSSLLDKDTVLVTSEASTEDILQFEDHIIASTIRGYNSRKIDMSSAVTKDDLSSESLSLARIDELADGLNTDISKVKIANALIRKYVLADGLIGRTQEIIVSNAPKKYSLSYGKLESDESRVDELNEIKTLIDSFNNDIDLVGQIAECISCVYLEGNYNITLRMKDGNSGIIDHYPLTFCYPSEYKSRGIDILEFNLTQLRNRLQKYYKRNRKNKAIYYKALSDEVKANYPSEVSNAFNNGEQYVRLNSKYSGSVKINDFGRRFGVSPYFKSLKYLYVLNCLEEADASDATARCKKIIFQKLRADLMGSDKNKKGFAEQAHAHSSAAAALKTNFCLYTAPAYVESLEYVVPKSSGMAEESKNQNSAYTEKLLQSLGIAFTGSSASVGVAKLNVQALLRTVDSITVRFARLMKHLYEALLEDNGYDRSLAPDLYIESAERSDLAIRMELAGFLYNTLGCSLETAYETVDVDVKNEYTRRIEEQELGYEDVFTPHSTAYTKSADSVTTNNGGRPKSSDDDSKQEYDREYYYNKTS